MMNGYLKWLSSTKFQIAFLAIGLIYCSQEFFKLNPEIATDAIVKLSLGYFTARIVEPIVEFVVQKLNILKGNKQ